MKRDAFEIEFAALMLLAVLAAVCAGLLMSYLAGGFL